MNELTHYGIKGMHWGVRRYDYAPKGRKRSNNGNDEKEKFHLSEKQKKALIATGAAGAAAIGALYLYKKGVLNPVHVSTYSYGKNIDVSKLSDKVTTISQKTRVHRMSTKQMETYRNDSNAFSAIYASYDKHDNHLYKEQMPKFFREWERKGIVETSTPYSHSIKLKRDIKIASEKDTALAYMKVNNVDHIDHGHYKYFMENLIDRNKTLNKTFADELKSKGFDGVFDMNDMEHFAKSPIIIFNPDSVVDSVKSHRVGNVEKFINIITS